MIQQKIIFTQSRIDVHKESVYMTALDEDGRILEQYEMPNSDEEWTKFREKYMELKPDIAMEMSTSGKYVARLLRDMGFSVHIADPANLALIFKSSKKNDKEDSYKLAKLLRLNELPEVYLPSKEAESLRNLVRYRKSLGEDITRLKNKVHAILSGYGIHINASDIFGKKGLKVIENVSSILSLEDRFILNNILLRINELLAIESMVEEEISKLGENNEKVRLLMTIPGINVYSASAILAEIDDISRFPTKEHLASYAGLVPRQDQSGSRDIRGHISKRGPSTLRFIMVNAAHNVIKFSKRMKSKYLSLVRRIGKNRAIVAIARILLEKIFIMLKKGEEFIDNIDKLTERKIRTMEEKAKLAKRAVRSIDIQQTIKLIKGNVISHATKELFS